MRRREVSLMEDEKREEDDHLHSSASRFLTSWPALD